MESRLVETTLQGWKIPYMMDEVNNLYDEEDDYNSKYRGSLTGSKLENYEDSLSFEQLKAFKRSIYQNNLEYIKKTYTKIIEICDKTTSLMNNDFGDKNSYIMKDYLEAKERYFYEDVTKYTVEGHWADRVYNLVCHVLTVFNNINDFRRFSNFKEKTKFTQMEAESIICYMKEKLDCKIKNFNNKFIEIPFKKDTLLAMKCINKFSSKNSITKDDTLDLFCEYIGESFFKET
jgi:hypothetical protein